MPVCVTPLKARCSACAKCSPAGHEPDGCQRLRSVPARGWQGGGEGGSSRGGASAEDEEELQVGVSEIASNRATGDRGTVDYYA